MSLRKRYTEYRDNRIRRDAFLAWAKNALAEGDVIAVSFPGIEEHYRVVKKAQGRDVVRIKKEYPHCIMCATGTGDTVKKSYESDEDVSDKYLWRRFFSTQLFEIWEEIGRWKDTPPLRHGLTDDEKSFLLDVVRKNSMHHLRTGKQLPATVFGRGSNRLDEPLSAGVAVWCRGEPRGCMIVCDKPCLLSVLEASAWALSDTRYKPLTPEELPETRFEITLFSDLGMPLLPTDVRHGEIYYEKAHRAQHDTDSAWCLPEVFNMEKFSSATDFIEYVVRKKGNFPAIGTSMCIFEAEDFIESADRTKAISLHGPIPSETPFEVRPSFQALFKDAADHLVKIADTGFIPGSIDPFSMQRDSAVSLTRGAFTACALLHYAAAVHSDIYRAVGMRMYEALAARHTTGIEEALTTGTYLGMAAQILGRHEDVAHFQRLVLNSDLLNAEDVQPIMFLQAARFLADMGDSQSLSRARAIFEKTLKSFRARKDSGMPISLAEYADLLVVSRQLGDVYSTAQEEISVWYESHQSEDGSFPLPTRVAYTRGTGKIFESLAYDPVRHARAIRRALPWLARMQYTPDSAFFIPHGRQPLCLGGFRHDALNTQAWPDAAGHVLLGGARLIQSGFSFLDRQ